MKRNNGITLIALIITVIIMVILAAITVNAIIEGRTADKLTDSTENYVYIEKKEIIQLIVSEAKVQAITNVIVSSNLYENMPQKAKEMVEIEGFDIEELEDTSEYTKFKIDIKQEKNFILTVSKKTGNYDLVLE